MIPKEANKMVKRIPPQPAEKQEKKSEGGGGRRFWDHLARNLALAGMLILTVAAVRGAGWPTGHEILTAAQYLSEPAWDETLGKISFVSSLFPESVSVFFESPIDASLTAPCFGTVSHAYSESEPYVGYLSPDGRVYAAASGQVMSLAHGENEEWVLRLRHDDGLETLYYGLQSVQVREGDQVTEQTCLGAGLSSEDIYIEVRRSGRPIDPTALIRPRGETP